MSQLWNKTVISTHKSFIIAFISLIVVPVTITAFAQGMGTISPGQSKSGTLASPGQSDKYSLNITKGGMYQIDMTGAGEGMDCYLRLSGGGVNTEDDDSGGNLNSRIVVNLNPGTYTISAEGFSGATGSYNLAVQGVQMRAISLGQTITGSISSAGASEIYSFNLAGPTAVTIRMTASGGGEGMNVLDTYLELRGNGMSLQDDDGGGALNSMISTQLQPGTYTIVCRAFGDSTGGYSLAVTQGLTDGGGGDNGNYDGGGDGDDSGNYEQDSGGGDSGGGDISGEDKP